VENANTAVALAKTAGGRVLIEPFDVAPSGRMALLSDPTGASFGVWEPKQRRGAQIVNEAGAWALNTLNTYDPKGAEGFYGSLFGWKTEVFGDGPSSIFRLTGYFGGEPTQPVPRDVVAMMRPVADHGQPCHWGVDFWVDDVDVATGRAAELGGVVLLSPRDSGRFRYAVLADSQGAVFTVSKMR
jgi:predicted enzyme related to lactoylglutathione lyase